MTAQLPTAMPTRYEALFSRLASKKEGAFVPFVVLGDPSPDLSFKIIQTLVENGADALELGIPFSDPLADGPTIQAASIRALNTKTTPKLCFDIIEKVRKHYPDLPIGLLMYANLVFSNGIESFYQTCKEKGVDSVLIADVPLQEADVFRQAALTNGIAPIFIAPPDADDATLALVSQLGQGYTYLLSRAGVTGAENKAEQPIYHLLDKLKAYQAPPALLGFGISTPQQVKQAIDAGVSGTISGSAVVKIIETHWQDEKQLTQHLAKFISDMKRATMANYKEQATPL